jgi:hypothetical protein
LYSIGVLFFLRYPKLEEGMRCRLHEKSHAGFEGKENGFPEKRTCTSFALDITVEFEA